MSPAAAMLKASDIGYIDDMLRKISRDFFSHLWIVSVLIESVSLERTGERAKPMIEKRREVERPLSRLEPNVMRRWRPSTRRARAMAASRDEGERSFLSSSW